jgi:hypothetical protein
VQSYRATESVSVRILVSDLVTTHTASTSVPTDGEMKREGKMTAPRVSRCHIKTELDRASTEHNIYCSYGLAWNYGVLFELWRIEIVVGLPSLNQSRKSASTYLIQYVI